MAGNETIEPACRRNTYIEYTEMMELPKCVVDAS